jgi:hypothetical protein
MSQLVLSTFDTAAKIKAGQPEGASAREIMSMGLTDALRIQLLGEQTFINILHHLTR